MFLTHSELHLIPLALLMIIVTAPHMILTRSFQSTTYLMRQGPLAMNLAQLDPKAVRTVTGLLEIAHLRGLGRTCQSGD